MIDYTVFGLSADATGADIETAYAALKRKYRADMLSEGEAGAEAARAVERLNAEYDKWRIGNGELRMKDALEKSKTLNSKFSTLNSIEEFIKSGQVAEAQAALDKINNRTAEWHFVQALVYYKKSWYSECRKHLEIAMKMEPDNKKYKDNYLSLLAYAEIMKQKALTEEEEKTKAASKGGDCCTGNKGSCVPCVGECCFKDGE